MGHLMKEVLAIGRKAFEDESKGEDAAGDNGESRRRANDDQGSIRGTDDKLSSGSADISPVPP